MNRRDAVRLLGLGAAGALLPTIASGQGARPGKLVQLTVSSRHVGPTRATIWLPDGYDAGRRRYGVLYMADGQNMFDPATAYLGQTWDMDRALSRLVAARAVAPVIVVGIWNAGVDRFRQYMPAAPTDRIPGMRSGIEGFVKGKLTSDDWLAFVTTELKPQIDRDYRTRPGRAHNAIGGSSMGGLIALYAIDKHPEIFARAACVSTHWPILIPEDGQPPKMREPVTAMWTGWLGATLGKPGGRKIWFDHGDRTLDQYYAPYQDAVDATLIGLGWRKGRDFNSRTYAGAAHDERSWAARLDDILRWTLPAA